MLNILNTHIFGDNFFVICKDESNFAIFIVDEYFKKIDKFPRMGNKQSFTPTFKNVEISLCKSYLPFNIAYNSFPESF